MTSSWHTRTVQETVDALTSDLELGLSNADAEERRQRWGPNGLPDQNSCGDAKSSSRSFRTA
jgi:hypothetical protein